MLCHQIKSYVVLRNRARTGRARNKNMPLSNTRIIVGAWKTWVSAMIWSNLKEFINTANQCLYLWLERISNRIYNLSCSRHGSEIVKLSESLAYINLIKVMFFIQGGNVWRTLKQLLPLSSSHKLIYMYQSFLASLDVWMVFCCYFRSFVDEKLEETSLALI